MIIRVMHLIISCIRYDNESSFTIPFIMDDLTWYHRIDFYQHINFKEQNWDCTMSRDTEL
jgi:hypothetical protein